jgi:hypothetical protein
VPSGYGHTLRHSSPPVGKPAQREVTHDPQAQVPATDERAGCGATSRRRLVSWPIRWLLGWR